MKVQEDRAFCQEMLPKVSRTFAACIRLLPPKVKECVLIAYLLCRIADTIEDTPDLGTIEKGELLAHFRSLLEHHGEDSSRLALAFAARRTHDEELVASCAIVLREWWGLTESERAAMRPWIQEMCDGMAQFVSKHSRLRAGHLETIGSVAELDLYCYYVAGTVGHLLTALFQLHYVHMKEQQYTKLKDLSTSFGLGLQLTNIIKDVADDHRYGWSFVPRELCHEVGLSPEMLLLPENGAAAKRVMGILIAKARRHLADALEYCTILPKAAYRIRLFCLTDRKSVV